MRILANNTTKSANGFIISFNGENELTIDEIWPEGNAPENPTSEDVWEVITNSGIWEPTDLIREWNLYCFAEINPA